jgi:glycosyltransferase involved in cell wall biosynthesis
VSDVCERDTYDIAVVNYPFMSAVFDVIPAYTRKILFTHDSFVDRNRRMLAQGLSSAGWVSLTRDGERLACRRADVVVALQNEEAAYFRSVCGDETAVVTVSPVFERARDSRKAASSASKLRVGYLGSSNWVNEENLGLYLKNCLDVPGLSAESEFLVAGAIDPALLARLTQEGEMVLAKLQPHFLGRVDDLQGFFDQCDVIVNPDRGGTGIKIKTLEALASGAAVITTQAAAVGIASTSRFHNAADPAALAALTYEIARDRSLIEQVRHDSQEVYGSYCERHHDAFDQLFGPVEAQHKGARAAAEPLVSVIIPFFDVEAYIGACIESVVGQDYANLEIILVDDASPCGSRGIAEKFAREDARVHIITHDVNRGLGPARNTGARAAAGTFIFFLDSDDLLAGRDALRKLVDTARQRSAEITVGACVKLMPDGELKAGDAADAEGSSNEFGGSVQGVEAFRAGLRLPRSAYLPPRAWGALIDRQFYIRAVLEFPPNEHEDLAHTPFIYYLANEVFYMREPVVTYRVRPDSISNSAWSPERILRYRDLWETFEGNIRRFGLDRHLGDAAVNLLAHMIWRIETNNADPAACDAVGTVIRDVLSTVEHFTYEDELQKFLRALRQYLKRSGAAPNTFLDIARCLPTRLLVSYYRQEVGAQPLEPRTPRKATVGNPRTPALGLAR